MDISKNVSNIDNFIKKKVFPKLREAMDNKISYAFNALMPEKMNLLFFFIISTFDNCFYFFNFRIL